MIRFAVLNVCLNRLRIRHFLKCGGDEADQGSVILSGLHLKIAIEIKCRNGWRSGAARPAIIPANRAFFCPCGDASLPLFIRPGIVLSPLFSASIKKASKSRLLMMFLVLKEYPFGTAFYLKVIRFAVAFFTHFTPDCDRASKRDIFSGAFIS